MRSDSRLRRSWKRAEDDGAPLLTAVATGYAQRMKVAPSEALAAAPSETVAAAVASVAASVSVAALVAGAYPAVATPEGGSSTDEVRL